MATHLDLEEQEQLDQLKHFWERWGTLITAVLLVALLALAGWNGYRWWQRSQAAQASILYDEVDRAAQAGDTARVERAFHDIRDKFGRTTYAQQAGLAAAKALYDKNNADGAQAALGWVADKGTDPGLQAVARLRLAAIHLDAKRYDDALKQLDGTWPTGFAGLAADRRGDVLAAQGKRDDAIAAYRSAWKDTDAASDYRRLVEVKLNALGVDPTAAGATAAAPATPAKP
ncbi:tetratricopeptide repeat protein [uncultured Xylophilus sp.]|uniref:YfgM family protein n=1 Tax=uncultured Xylophilus sp. TaxID=296832 RepID=UPI0025FE58D4|nr:tetratricopeptide repeat protein [uncultured Xylophilus sp.]